MSEPGRYVVVRHGRWKAITINTGGYEIDQITVLGADATLRMLGIYDTCDDGWEARTSRAGALIDFDHRVLLVCTEQLDAGQRTAYLDALGRT